MNSILNLSSYVCYVQLYPRFRTWWGDLTHDLCQEWSKVSSASALWEASTAVASDHRAFGVMYTPLGSCEMLWNWCGTWRSFGWFGVELLWNCGTSQCEHLASRHHKASRDSRDTVHYSTVHQSDDTTGTEWLNWGKWLGDYFLRDGSWWICCFSLKPTRTCLNAAVSKWTTCYCMFRRSNRMLPEHCVSKLLNLFNLCQFMLSRDT